MAGVVDEKNGNDSSAEQRRATWKLALLSVVTVGGATNGFLSCLIWLLNNQPSHRQIGVVLLLAALYLFGIWSGIAYKINEQKGRNLAKIFLIIQIPVIQSGVISFKFWALGACTVLFDLKSLTFDLGGHLGSNWEFTLLVATHENIIGVNLLPWVVMSLLWGAGDIWPLLRTGRL
jgi:hypothetical protein